MADDRGPLRVLQLIGDTDADEGHRAALDLHRALVAHGLEVRTLALAPGRRGGLDGAIPVLAPSRRSWTIRRILDRECRWADVTLLQVPGALTRSTRRRSGRPPVVAAVPATVFDHEPFRYEGVDAVVVLGSSEGDGCSATEVVGEASSAGGTRVVRWQAPADARAWKDLLSGCVARSA